MEKSDTWSPELQSTRKRGAYPIRNPLLFRIRISIGAARRQPEALPGKANYKFHRAGGRSKKCKVRKTGLPEWQSTKSPGEAREYETVSTTAGQENEPPFRKANTWGLARTRKTHFCTAPRRNQKWKIVTPGLPNCKKRGSAGPTLYATQC